jgi:hypothetical protein
VTLNVSHYRYNFAVVYILYAVCIQTSVSILRDPTRYRLDRACEVCRVRRCGILHRMTRHMMYRAYTKEWCGIKVIQVGNRTILLCMPCINIPNTRVSHTVVLSRIFISNGHNMQCPVILTVHILFIKPYK